MQSVESVLRQTLPPDELILVIDHNPVLLALAQQRFPALCVLENTQAIGLSGARNSGILTSNADIIAFLDDDAVAQPDWLQTLLSCLADPDVIGAGSRVEPVWTVPRPAWFPDEFQWVVGCTYRGLPTVRAEVRSPIGASMIIRRSVFAQVGTFRNGIGRVGKTLLGSEETELCIRARQAMPGRKFIHEPATFVQHQVSAKRTRWSYFCARCYSEGQSKALITQTVGYKDALSAERQYLLKVLPAGAWRGIADTLVRRDGWGLARTAAIVFGTAMTAAGYVAGRINLIQ